MNTGLTTVEYLPDGTFGVELVEIALKAMVRAQEHLLVVGRQNSLEKVSIFLAEILERQGGGDVIDLPMSRTDISTVSASPSRRYRAAFQSFATWVLSGSAARDAS